MKKMEFTCKIILMLNWYDESLRPFMMNTGGNRDHPKAYGGAVTESILEQHFMPRVAFHDLRGGIKPEGVPQVAVDKNCPVALK